MIKQIVLNGAVNNYSWMNRPAGWVSLNYDTDEELLILRDTFNNTDTILTISGQISILPEVKQMIKDTEIKLQTKINAGIAGAFKFKGSVSTSGLLPLSANNGDVYQVIQSNAEYAYDGNKWVELGTNVDLTKIYSTIDNISSLIKNDYYTKLDIDNKGFLINQIDPIFSSTSGIFELSSNLNIDIDNHLGILLSGNEDYYLNQKGQWKELKISHDYLPLSGGIVNGLTIINSSFINGDNCIISGNFAHAQGYSSKALVDYAHAEGNKTTANGKWSHTQGRENITDGYWSHAQGYGNSTTSWGQYAHAEGQGTKAHGYASHVEGRYTITNGQYSHAEGIGTITQKDGQHVEGYYNDYNATDIMQIGCGTSNTDRKNAFIIDFSGNTQIYNDLYIKGNQKNNGLLSANDFITNDKLHILSNKVNKNDLTYISGTIDNIQNSYISNININGQKGNINDHIANLTLPTCNPFPYSFTLSATSKCTTLDFCTAIANEPNAQQGMMYLGSLMVKDMPFIGNSQVIVRIMTGSGATTNKVIVLQMFSTNRTCNHWYAMYYNGQMQTTNGICPWRGIMSIPITKRGDDPQYLPSVNYDAVSKLYLEQRISGLNNQLTGLQVQYNNLVNITNGIITGLQQNSITSSLVRDYNLIKNIDVNTDINYQTFEDLLD